MSVSLAELCALNAPSGFEGDALQALLEPLCDAVSRDAMGNLFAVRKSANPDAKTLLLEAHWDQIGLIVTGYRDGFLRFSTLGGVDPRLLPAAEVEVQCGSGFPGVITCLPPHIQSKEEMERAFAEDALYIDVGLSDADARKKIPVGTPVTFCGEFTRLGERYLCSRSLDNRAGVWALLQVLEAVRNEALHIHLVVLLSAQEEVGCRGAEVGGFRVQPDWAVAVDVTHGVTADYKKFNAFELGSGAIVATGPHLDRKLTAQLFDLGKDLCGKPEPCTDDTGTDASIFHTTAQGIPTGLVSIPLRYMHTPGEVAHEQDLAAVSELLLRLVRAKSEEVRHG